MEEIDRYLGALLGLATGDALGAPLEFRYPGSFAPIKNMVGGGVYDLKPGQWTDDTSMALCLAESLIECGEFNPVDQLERYLRWFRHGYLSSTGLCFDIGRRTKQALTTFERTHERFCGSAESGTASNGSLMRLAPVPLFFANDPIMAIVKSGESSLTTHGAIAAVDACRYLGSMICGILKGEKKDILLSEFYCVVKSFWKTNPLTSEIAEIASGSFKRKNPPEITGSIFVARSLEAALWAFFNSKSFKEGCLLAVNLGNDADTTGAIYGQLAGAFYGIQGIPKNWLNKIAHRSQIENYAKRLFFTRYE